MATAVARMLYDNQGGPLGADPGSGGSTITFSAVPDFATLTSGQYIPIMLDPGTGTFEIVHMTAYTAGSYSGTILRAQEDSTNWPAVAHPNGSWVCAPTAFDAQGPGLSITTYGPASPDLVNLTTTQMHALDTTNLTFTFVAPMSGNVLITVSAYWYCPSPTSATATTIVYGGLQIHGSSTQVGPRQRVTQSLATAATDYAAIGARVSVPFYVTGLTPGTIYQYDLCGWYVLTAGALAAATFPGLFCDDGVSGGTDELGPVIFMVDASL